MNKEHNLYSRYLGISNDWPLDDWSITKECFDNIVNIIPFEKTILETSNPIIGFIINYANEIFLQLISLILHIL